MELASTPRVDRHAYCVESLDQEPDEKAYWRAKSPAERLEALELMRQIVYGYDPATSRLQRFFEVAELSRS